MKKKLLIIFITVFIDLVGFGIIIPLNPYLAKVYGASPIMVGVLMSIYSMMQFIFSPIWGQLSDRFGRRPIILISLLGASLAHLGFAFSASFTGLLVSRLLAGVFGGNLPVAMAYIADVTPEKDRSKGMGLIGAAFGLGFILGPTIGGVFADVGHRLGDSPPFGGSFSAVIASGICFLNFVSAYFFLEESLDRSAVRSTMAQSEGRLQRVWRGLLSPSLGRFLSLYFLNTLTLAQVEAALFLFVQDRFQWTYSNASYGFAYIGIMMAFTQGFLIRRLLPKVGEVRMARFGFISTAIGLALIAVSYELWMLAMAVTFLSIGNGLSSPALSGGISLTSRSTEQGGNLGIAQSLSSLARILGPVIGGALYQKVTIVAPFFFSASIAVLSLVLSMRLRLKTAE